MPEVADAADPGTTGNRPLEGARVLVPRASGQAGELSARIRALGGDVVEAPVLVIEPGDETALADAAAGLAAGRFAAVCFTSPNGVRAVATVLATHGHDASVVRSAGLLACVGAGTTRALDRELGLTPDLVPDTATTAALGAAMPPGRGEVLLPRADIANPRLPVLLRDKGYTPVEVVAYRTGRPDRLPDAVVDALAAGRITHVAVASPSTARNLVALIGERPLGATVVSIGPVTSAACRELGLPVAVEAEPHDLDGLVAALVRAR